MTWVILKFHTFQLDSSLNTYGTLYKATIPDQVNPKHLQAAASSAQTSNHKMQQFIGKNVTSS